MDTENRCERFDELLPWYVNGSLDVEAEVVREHLAGCERCREEAEWLATVGAHLRASANRPVNGPVKPVQDASFSRLLQHIAADDQRRQRSHLAMAAALLLAIAVTLGLALSWQPLAPRYQTVTDAVPRAASTVLMELELAPDAPLSSLYDVLERHDAVIVAGPDATGRFQLEVPLRDGENPSTLAQMLRAERNVLRATPLSRNVRSTSGDE